MKILSFLAIPLISIFLCACSDANLKKTDPDYKFEQKIGSVSFLSKIAVSELEKARGLMNIDSLPENEGMIFVNEFPTMCSYWMKNTKVPLDIAFIDPFGTILEIRQMFPHDTTPVRSKSANVLYCLEMNQGWFAKNKIKSGDKLDMNILSEAIKQRRSR